MREVREELGCGITVDGIHEVVFHAYPDFDLYMLVYASRITDGQPRAVEVAEIAWVPGASSSPSWISCPPTTRSPGSSPPADRRSRPRLRQCRLRRGAGACSCRCDSGRGRGRRRGGRRSRCASRRARRRAERRCRRGAAAPRARGARRLHRVALARAAHGRLGPGAEVRLQLALGRPVDRRPAPLAGDLHRLLVLEEVAAVLATRSGGRISRRRLHLAALALACCCAASQPPRGDGRLGRATSRRRGPRPPPAGADAGRRPSTAHDRLVGLLSARAGRPPPAARPSSRSTCPCSCRSCRGSAVLEIADLLRAVLAVLRIGIAGLPAHGARELAAALVDPGRPCSRERRQGRSTSCSVR